MFTLGGSLYTGNLPRVDRVLLWSMRSWVIGLKRRFDMTAPLREAFGLLDAPDAVELVDAAMCVVACGATRVLTVECVCCRIVSQDERHLLAAASACQAKRGLEAVFILREVLAPPACRDAAQLFSRLGAVLTAGGRRLSPWAIDMERFGYQSVPKTSPVRMLH